MDRLPLGIRNRLAELILEAFEREEARRAIAALASYCAGPEPVALGEETRAALRSLPWFEELEGVVRLRGVHRPYREAFCQRVQAARTLLERERKEPGAPPLLKALARAGALFDARLYFEVHELLEPYWFRAEGAERRTLQGVIQVAVAFHHLDTGNREGATSLLAEGLAKLEAGERVLPLRLGEWREALSRALASLRAGEPVAAPSFPAPREEAAWRSS